MKAIRVYLDERDTDLVGSVVEMLNEHEEIAATMVGAKELFITAEGECSIKYAECVVQKEFKGEITVQSVK